MLLPVDYELLSTIIFNSDHKENYTKPYTQKVNHEKILKMLKQSTERQENRSRGLRQRNKQKANNKISDLSPISLITTWTVNGLNTQAKKQRSAKWTNQKKTELYCLQEINFIFNEIVGWK